MRAEGLSSKDFKIFKDYHSILRENLTENDNNTFMSCPNDKAKFLFILEKVVKSDKLNFKFSFESSKNNELAQNFKDKGNIFFQQEKYMDALKMYNQALVQIDFGRGSNTNKDVSIIIANRSAVLNHLQKYEEALEDIQTALDLGYPKDIAYKVKERKAKCLLAMKQHKSSLDAFKQALTSLDDGKIPKEKKKQMQLNIQIMIGMLSKNKNLIDEPLTKSEQKPLKTFEKNNKEYPVLTSKVTIVQNEKEGRFTRALENIKVGENILVEDPYASVLLEIYAKTHCYHCLKSVSLTPYPCKTCSRIIFCSRKCDQAAQNSHHAIECSLIPFIWKSGLSVICYLSLRMISQSREDFFRKIQTYLQDSDKDSKFGQLSYTEKRYIRTHSGITHSNRRKLDDYLHTTHVAVFLYQLLKQTNYFQAKDPEFEEFIGGLLLHQIQFIQFNCHEVADLIKSGSDAKTRFIGAGTFPTLSMFNHSCEPNIVRYFRGNKVYVNLCKNITKGDQICENYGPLYSEMPKPERQEQLKSHYWFDCHCIACENNWSSFDDLEKSQILRFKCETSGCNNVVEVSITTDEFMIKCDLCDKFVNIFKGLKSLQDTESLFRLANNYRDTGDYDKALEKFTELMNLLDENLAPPYKDYLLCQRAIQTCFLNLGNLA
uniref:SET and MYND domain-containing protein 4 n=1 Tax=Cacopsylla melanoneura TaxID=428564 RepID=A0A8D8RD30_9HEMI